MLHIPDICKNLISESTLSKKGFRMIFESNKFVFTKGRVYMGNGYLVDGLFKANIAVVDQKSVFVPYELINKVNSSICLLEPLILWHNRLEHVNCKSL